MDDNHDNRLRELLDRLAPFPHICHHVALFLPLSYLNEDYTLEDPVSLTSYAKRTAGQQSTASSTHSQPCLFHLLQHLLPLSMTYENKELLHAKSHYRHALLPGISTSFLLGMDMPWEGLYRLLQTAQAPLKTSGLLRARYEKAYGMTHGLVQACLVHGDFHRLWDALSPIQPLPRQFLFAIQVLHWLLEDSRYSRPGVHRIREDKVLLSQYQDLGRRALAILHAEQPVFDTWSWRCWLYLDMMSERMQTCIPIITSPQELLPPQLISGSVKTGYPIQYRFYRFARSSRDSFFAMQPEVFDSNGLINVGLNMMLSFQQNRNFLGHVMQSKAFHPVMFQSTKLPLFLLGTARLAFQMRSPVQEKYNPFHILDTNIQGLPFDEVMSRTFFMSGFQPAVQDATRECQMVWFDVRRKLVKISLNTDIFRVLLREHASYFNGDMPGPFPSTFSKYDRSQWRQAMLLFFFWKHFIQVPGSFDEAWLEGFLTSIITKWDPDVIWCVACICIAVANELPHNMRSLALLLRAVWVALGSWEYRRDDLRKAIATVKQWISLGVLGRFGFVISRVHEFPWSHQTTHNTTLVCWNEVARFRPDFQTCLANFPSGVQARPHLLDVCLCLWMDPTSWSLFFRRDSPETSTFLRFSLQLQNDNGSSMVLCDDTPEEPFLGSQETKLPEFPCQLPIVPFVTTSYQCRCRTSFLSPYRQRDFAWSEWWFQSWPLCGIQDTQQIVSCAEALLAAYQWKPEVLPSFTQRGLAFVSGVQSIATRIEEAFNQDVPVFVDTFPYHGNTTTYGVPSQENNENMMPSKRQRIM